MRCACTRSTFDFEGGFSEIWLNDQAHQHAICSKFYLLKHPFKMIYTHRVSCYIWERDEKPAFDPVFRIRGEQKLEI
jgi:hypothetical protein